ncbi:MAG: hypothetical protein R3Y60_00630 [bacterium]
MAKIKVQYNGCEDDAVRLFQYIFSDENSGRYALFNFHNQYTESVHELSFIVKQQDENGETIKKSKLTYGDLNAKENSFFVPKVKLLLDENCKYLDVSVVECFFTESYYLDGKITTPPVKEVEEKFDPKTLHSFTNKQIYKIRNQFILFLFAILFIAFSLMVLMAYTISNTA